MEPLLATAVGTALERAFAVAEAYLAKAQSAKSANISGCIEYLRAAQTALAGLEDEVDEILIEAKVVARFYWEKHPALYERIEQYVTRDRLRPLLGRSIEGIIACHKFAEQDARAFLAGDEKKEAVAEVLRLLGELSGYMASLGHQMNYSRENYVSGSGIAMPELLQIQGLLLGQDDEAQVAQRRDAIVGIVESSQRNRVRRGQALAAQAARTIQELTVVFKVQRGG